MNRKILVSHPFKNCYIVAAMQCKVTKSEETQPSIKRNFPSIKKHEKMSTSPTPKEALRRIEEAKQKNMKELDLRKCGLKSIPIEIANMYGLEKLALNSNQIQNIENINKLHNLKELYLNSNELKKIKNIENLTKLNILTISFNKIERIEGLENLIHLNYLKLTSNRIKKIEGISSLINLTRLDLNYNRIKEIEGLDFQENLRKLYVSANQIKNIKGLNKLFQLKELAIGGNQINKIENIETLSNLTLLNLSSNKISRIEGLNSLINLNELYLSDNQLKKIEGLRTLMELKILNLGTNRIEEVEDLEKLSKLNELYIDNNQIKKIEGLENLTQLNKLHLSYNQIARIEGLENLTQLNKLHLSYNQIARIEGLDNLTQLAYLDIENNSIKNISKYFYSNKKLILFYYIIDKKWKRAYSIKRFNRLNRIFLYGNHLICPPSELISEEGDNTALIEYFDSLEKEGSELLNEVRLLIVGQGEAGKTSLIKALLEEEYDAQEAQTHGIRIRSEKIPIQKEEITLHFWDFGGQEIMHATHQFFLSKRSLYVLVIDSRNEKRTDYWLKHIHAYGGNSPVLIVLNKIDANPAFDLDEQQIRRNYPNRIIGFYKVSCSTRKGIKALRKALYQQVYDMPMRQTPFSADWLGVKNKLIGINKDRRPYISYAYFKDICHEHHIHQSVTQNVLMEFFNDLGISLHYKDLRQHDTQLLNPLWLTNGVYRIINSTKIAKKKGIVRFGELHGILNSTDHPDEEKLFVYEKDKVRYIIDMMQSFELCYTTKDRTYLIPNLLQVQEPTYELDEAKAAKLLLQYNFLPHAVFIRLLVRLHEFIDGRLLWRSGVVLHYPLDNRRAVVRFDLDQQQIWIFADQDNREAMIQLVWNTLKEIHSSYANMQPTEKVPLPDSAEVDSMNAKIVRYTRFVPYQQLKNMEQAGEEFYRDWSTSDGKKYRVSELLNGITEAEDRKAKHKLPPLQVFIAYSLQDEAYFKALTKHLKILQGKEWIRIEDGLRVDAGLEVSKTLNSKFERADVLLCLLSADFFEEEFEFGEAMRELLEVYLQSDVDRMEKRIVPLLARPCLVGDSAFGGLAPINGAPIGNPEDDFEWVEILERLKEILVGMREWREKGLNKNG